jgi:hypothetical protein
MYRIFLKLSRDSYLHDDGGGACVSCLGSRHSLKPTVLYSHSRAYTLHHHQTQHSTAMDHIPTSCTAIAMPLVRSARSIFETAAGWVGYHSGARIIAKKLTDQCGALGALADGLAIIAIVAILSIFLIVYMTTYLGQYISNYSLDSATGG